MMLCCRSVEPSFSPAFQFAFDTLSRLQPAAQKFVWFIGDKLKNVEPLRSVCGPNPLFVGTWLSLVEHSLGVRGVGSSNLPVPTNSKSVCYALSGGITSNRFFPLMLPW